MGAVGHILAEDENWCCVKKYCSDIFSPLVGNFISDINRLFMTYEIKTNSKATKSSQETHEQLKAD